ncbi:MAG: outer membrane lipoprotein-sorting protein [Rhodocyclaceae bacterium]
MTHMKHILMAAACMLPVLASASAEGNAVLEEADHARGGTLPGLAWTITLTSHDADGSTVRVMQAIVDDRAARVEYTEPAKMRGQRIVMVGRNMWFLRPGLQRPVPLSPRQRLLGAASNGDVAATRYARDYEADIEGHERIDGEDCVVLNLIARERSATYDRIRYWVSEARALGVKAEFYTVSGKLFKTARFDYANRVGYEGRRFPFISRMTITDAINRDNVTVLDYSQVQVKRPDPSLFELGQ